MTEIQQGNVKSVARSLYWIKQTPSSVPLWGVLLKVAKSS